MRYRRVLLLLSIFLPLGFAATSYAAVAGAFRSEVSTLPTVNLVLPTKGSVTGGTNVAVVGTNLTGAMSVSFGGVQSPSFLVDSPTSITAESPPGTGTVDITVTTPSGTSQTSSADQFTYVTHPPVVSAVNPTRGLITGGTKVSIVGSDFGAATSVNFGSNEATSFRRSGDDLIVATSPAGTGTVDITVTTPQGTSSLSTADEFTYVAQLPTIRLVNPARGEVSGGTTVTVLGSNFRGASAVNFGGTPATSFVVNSAHQITAVSPAGTDTVDVSVTTPQGTSSVVPHDQFVYGFPSPTVEFILPTKGDALGGTRVAVIGSSFIGATSVDFGSTPAAKFTVNSDQSVTATAPPGTGVVDVTVTTPQGSSATSSSDQFTYLLHPPVVKEVLPNSGSAGGGTTVTIVGANFKGATAVDFGGTSVTSFEVDSNQVITATSPAGSGTVDITVTTAQGSSATSSADQFAYD